MGHAEHLAQGLAHKEDRAQGSQRPRGQGWLIESIGSRATLSNWHLCQKAALPGQFWEGRLTLHLAACPACRLVFREGATREEGLGVRSAQASENLTHFLTAQYPMSYSS